MILSNTNWLTEIAALADLRLPVRAISLADLPHRLRYEPGYATVNFFDGDIRYWRAARVGNTARGWLSVGGGMALAMQWVRIGFGDRATWVCPRCDQLCIKLYLLGENHDVVGCTRCMKDSLRRTIRRQTKALRLEDQIRRGRRRYMHRRTMEAITQKVAKLRKTDMHP